MCVIKLILDLQYPNSFTLTNIPGGSTALIKKLELTQKVSDENTQCITL